jgi:hypothetical protein
VLPLQNYSNQGNMAMKSLLSSWDDFKNIFAEKKLAKELAIWTHITYI